jgi:NitT/TauT family transport system permease protein
LSIGIGIITASPLGIILGQSQRLDKIFLPFIYLLYPIPKVVFVPLAILFFGLGEFPKVLIIYVIIFFQIVVLVRDQAKTLKPELILSVRSLGAGRRALFRFVYLPSTLPAIFTAIRQSTGTAIAVLYLTELFGTKYGLGYYIFLTGSTLLDYSSMYAGILAMSLLGLGIYLGIEFLQKRLCPWLFIEMPH